MAGNFRAFAPVSPTSRKERGKRGRRGRKAGGERRIKVITGHSFLSRRGFSLVSRRSFFQEDFENRFIFSDFHHEFLFHSPPTLLL